MLHCRLHVCNQVDLYRLYIDPTFAFYGEEFNTFKIIGISQIYGN